MLRSKSPDLVTQEIWGHLCCHYAIRPLMFDAAEHSGHDPDWVWQSEVAPLLGVFVWLFPQVPPIPRGRRCSPGRPMVFDRRLPLPNGQPPHPAGTSHRAEHQMTRPQRRFTQFTRPVFPSPVAPGMEQGPLGFYPELRTPPLPATHVRVETGLKHRPRTTRST